ncbi:MAG: DUF5683 domain-containing protein [Leptospiraceae bacterium]|nr:hypothetical protein [Leptospiraceae bacterium]MCK6381798.1 DUF5683 domain-containing protein [Leptospiraceae bacterium]
MKKILISIAAILIVVIEVRADIVTFRSGKVVENVKTTILKDSVVIQYEEGRKETRPKGEIKSLKVRSVVWRLAEEKKRKQNAEAEARFAEEKRKAEEEEKARVAEASEKGTDFELRAEEDKISPTKNAALGMIPIYSGAYRTGKMKTGIAMSILEGLALLNTLDFVTAKKKHTMTVGEVGMLMMSLPYLPGGQYASSQSSSMGSAGLIMFAGSINSQSYTGGITGRKIVNQIGTNSVNERKINSVRTSTYAILVTTLLIDSIVSGFSASEWNEGTWTGDVGARPSTPGSRGIRSAFFPGWGQLYGGNTTKGSIFLTTGITLIATAMGLDNVVKGEQSKYRGNQNNIMYYYYNETMTTSSTKLPNAAIYYLANSNSVNSRKAVGDAVKNRNNALGVLIGFWIYNIFDAVYFSGKSSQAGSFQIRPEISVAKTQSHSNSPAVLENKVGLTLEYVF